MDYLTEQQYTNVIDTLRSNFSDDDRVNTFLVKHEDNVRKILNLVFSSIKDNPSVISHWIDGDRYEGRINCLYDTKDALIAAFSEDPEDEDNLEMLELLNSDREIPLEVTSVVRLVHNQEQYLST